MKALLLSQNYRHYTGGYYHQDWVNALSQVLDCDIYGPGYDNYDSKDSLDDVCSKFGSCVFDYDLIIMSSSWDRPGQDHNDGRVDIHPAIKLNDIGKVKKIYFLNKEYINLEAKLEYAEDQGVDLIVSVLPYRWFVEKGIKLKSAFLCLPFAVDFDRIVTSSVKYDFGFTGALHASYVDERWLVKKEVFSERASLLQRLLYKFGSTAWPAKNWDFLSSGYHLPSNKGLFRLISVGNPLSKAAKKHSIYWAERHPLSKTISGQNLLPFGEAYFRLLAQCSAFLCTRSADGIMGPRFYEVMASGSVIICPTGNYDDLLVDGENCLMYRSSKEVIPLVSLLINDKDLRLDLVKNAMRTVQSHSYKARVADLFSFIKEGGE